ncbi:MAG TPA: HlyD family secretion protein [Xanthobacteraceae bacterium]|nr:HlyD family secretion protein [Xanthobacteraceae bacterium]
MAEALRKPTPVRDEAPENPRTLPLSPAAPLDKRAQKDGSGEGVRRLRRRDRIRWSLFALLPLVLIIGGYWYVTGGQIMSTDDAYLEADKVGISTDVAGIVKDVDVKENEQVTAGQVLYRLDPLQFQIALDNAKANLAQTALSIEAMKQDYARMVSDIAAQQAQVNLDQTNFDRATMLLRSGTTTQAAYDQAQATLQTDKSKLDSLREQAQVQLARLGGKADIDVTQHPQYLQAKAQVEEAQRQLDHTVVTAPFAGIVTDVPAIAPGKYLAASTTAFFLVDTDHVWVNANPKETELTYVRPGQVVTITVDTYPGVEWRGTVESISPAAAQEFSLLPAQNTSGNWVKVVQRVPMRVRVDTSDKTKPPLRAGMSVEVDVDTGHARGFPHLF